MEYQREPCGIMDPLGFPCIQKTNYVTTEYIETPVVNKEESSVMEEPYEPLTPEQKDCISKLTDIGSDYDGFVKTDPDGFYHVNEVFIVEGGFNIDLFQEVQVDYY